MQSKNLGKIIRAIVKKEVLIAVSEAYELNKKELFSKKETAEMLGVSTRTLDRWREDGIIVSFETGENGKVLYKKSVIVNFLKQEGHGR